MEKTNWFEEAVVYQIYPFSFRDADNDGWGDLAGIREKLDYLKELGVTAIWFSPLYPSPDVDFGYDIADYRGIDPKFGTLDAFRALLDDCHARGIRVIMDMALNHSSTEHPWFKAALADPESPYRDYYFFRKGIRKGKKLLPPTNWDSTFTGSAWERVPGTDDFYLHLFCPEQADLNWENPAVRREAAEIFNYWLELGVDGFRLDVFNLFSKELPFRNDRGFLGKGGRYYIDGPRMHEYLRELNERAFSRFDCFTVGESYQPHPEDARRYACRDSRELDAIFNFAPLKSDCFFGFQFLPRPFSLRQFKKGLFGPQEDNFDNGWNTLVIENHDLPRSVSHFGIPTDCFRYEAATLLAAVCFLGFGTPFIYMGEELGLTNSRFDSLDQLRDPVSHFVYGLMTRLGIPKRLAFKLILAGARDHARVPFPWDASANGGFNEGAEPWQCVNPNYAEINAEADLASERSVYRFYQQVFQLRRSEPAALRGRVTELFPDSRRLIAYTRGTLAESGEGYAVLGNFSKRSLTLTLPDELKQAGQVLLTNYGRTYLPDGALTLAPYEVLVIR